MLKKVSMPVAAKTLLIDFCGEEPLLALTQGGSIEAELRLPSRMATAGWLPAVKRLLSERQWRLADLQAIGVVGGPGSFTGVRTGLAAAKGLCEAASLKLAVVSRLAVLATAAESGAGLAVLYAGRDQVYVRVPAASAGAGPGKDATEALITFEALTGMAAQRPVFIAEPRLADLLPNVELKLVRMGPEHILSVVHEVLERGETPVSEADANYVRAEGDIYRRSALGSAGTGA